MPRRGARNRRPAPRGPHTAVIYQHLDGREALVPVGDPWRYLVHHSVRPENYPLGVYRIKTSTRETCVINGVRHTIRGRVLLLGSWTTELVPRFQDRYYAVASFYMADEVLQGYLRNRAGRGNPPMIRRSNHPDAFTVEARSGFFALLRHMPEVLADLNEDERHELFGAGNLAHLLGRTAVTQIDARLPILNRAIRQFPNVVLPRHPIVTVRPRPGDFVQVLPAEEVPPGTPGAMPNPAGRGMMRPRKPQFPCDYRAPSLLVAYYEHYKDVDGGGEPGGGEVPATLDAARGALLQALEGVRARQQVLQVPGGTEGEAEEE